MQYLIYITVFFIPFYFLRFVILKIPTNPFEIAVLITFIAAIVLAVSHKSFKWGPIWPYLLLVTSGSAVLLSDSFISGLGIFKGWFLIPFLLYLSIINTFDQESLNKLSIPLYFSILVISSWAIMQKFGIITTLFYQKGDPSFDQYLTTHFRVFGPFESPNYLAMFIVPAALLSIPIFNLVQNRIVKILVALTFLAPLFTLFLSGSRAGLIGLVFAVLVYLFISKKDRFLDSVIISTGLAVVVFLALAMAAYKYGFNPTSDAVRIEIYKYSWQLVKGNWLFGLGAGNFYDRIAAINPMADTFRTFALPYALHPHNVFLAFWLNLGLAGLILFIVNLIWFFKVMIQNYSKTYVWGVALMAMIVILIHGLFDTTYFKNDLSALFWLTMAIGFVISKESSTEKSTN